MSGLCRRNPRWSSSRPLHNESGKLCSLETSKRTVQQGPDSRRTTPLPHHPSMSHWQIVVPSHWMSLQQGPLAYLQEGLQLHAQGSYLLSLRRGGRSFAETSGSRSAELRCSMLALPAQLPHHPESPANTPKQLPVGEELPTQNGDCCVALHLRAPWLLRNSPPQPAPAADRCAARPQQSAGPGHPRTPRRRRGQTLPSEALEQIAKLRHCSKLPRAQSPRHVAGNSKTGSAHPQSQQQGPCRGHVGSAPAASGGP
mmetsp:Transcript_1269/g.2189  ORF Transcript_1269/g.2189 Transcript_1269/m.2189 type:complete len:256 (+) Transcript_1269:490-1257(+)